MVVTFLLIGLGAGLLSGLFGIGGGILIVPALVFFAKLPQSMASGTSLGALTLPVLGLGAWQYYKAGQLNVTGSLLVGAGLFLGSYFGARIGVSVDPVIAKKSFAVFLVLIAGRMWMTA